MKKALLVILILVMTVTLSGCAKIVHCDVSINNDLTGTWKAKVFSTEPISKTMIDNNLKEGKLTGYTLKPIKESIDYLENGKPQTMDGWEVVMNWANTEELNKIIAYMRTGGSGFGTGIGNKNAPEPLTVGEDGTITVNFGQLQYNKLSLTIKGDIIEGSTQGKVNGRTIEFAPNQEIKLQFKPSKMPEINKTTIQIGAGGLILLAGGFYYMRRKSSSAASKAAE